MRSWVEIYKRKRLRISRRSRPLREVVSWNVCAEIITASFACRPLREVVSWNGDVYAVIPNFQRRPLREVVSWNGSWNHVVYGPFESTSSWGRELKYHSSGDTELGWAVDLFVRSWVEIAVAGDYDRATGVDLFVRSWVEMKNRSRWGRREKVDLFVRSWVEMVFPKMTLRLSTSRPLREVVSWNPVK